MTSVQQDPSKFEKELTKLINQHSIDNHCKIPDYILANYLVNCMEAIRDASCLLNVHKQL